MHDQAPAAASRRQPGGGGRGELGSTAAESCKDESNPSTAAPYQDWQLISSLGLLVHKPHCVLLHRRCTCGSD